MMLLNGDDVDVLFLSDGKCKASSTSIFINVAASSFSSFAYIRRRAIRTFGWKFCNENLWKTRIFRALNNRYSVLVAQRAVYKLAGSLNKNTGWLYMALAEGCCLLLLAVVGLGGAGWRVKKFRFAVWSEKVPSSLHFPNISIHHNDDDEKEARRKGKRLVSCVFQARKK